MRVVDVQNTGIGFPDPAELGALPVSELLEAAARGHLGIDQRFIRAIVDRGEDAVPELVEFGLRDHSEDLVDLEEDLIAIFRHLGSKKALPYFVKLVRNEPTDIPDDLVNGIMQMAPEIIEPLLEVYRETEEDESSDIAFLLASLRVRDERILKVLLDRLEYDAADGAFCLGVFGDPAAKPALETLLAEIPESDHELRREIGFALGQIQNGEEGQSEPEAFDIWEMYPPKAKPPVDVLSEAERLEMLESPSAELRALAASALGVDAEQPKVRAALIRHAKSDPDPVVRGRGWEALTDAADEVEIRDAMKAVLHNPEVPLSERSGALLGLASRSDDPEIAGRMREFYDNPTTRAAALEAMWRSFDRQFADFFPKHLDDPDPELKRQAIYGVGYNGMAGESSRLQALLEVPAFRTDALFAYAMCVPGDVSRGRIRSLLKKVEDAACGFDEDEEQVVKLALDERLMLHGLEPVFNDMDEADGEEPAIDSAAQSVKVGRNDPCPCGSGKKYKKCHGF